MSRAWNVPAVDARTWGDASDLFERRWEDIERGTGALDGAIVMIVREWWMPAGVELHYYVEGGSGLRGLSEKEKGLAGFGS